MGADPRRHVHAPYPELVEREVRDEPYRIHDSLDQPLLPARGMVDLHRRVMWVPLEPCARCVTRHEMGHVRWSPACPMRVRFDGRVLMCVEDARVNLGLAGRDLPVVLDAEGHAEVLRLLARDVKARDGFALFARGVASVGTSVEEAIEEQLLATAGPLAALVVGWMRRARRELEGARVRSGADVAPYARGVALARRLARQLRALGLLDAKGLAGSRVRLACCVGDLPDGEGIPGMHRLRVPTLPGGGDRTGVEVGSMRVEAAPLTVPLRRGRGGRAWRAASEGSVVRFLHRWPVDRAVFRRRARRGGGTLLVDTSGSMSFTSADLDRLLLATPWGMRVAIYSALDSAGELRIVADGHRRAPAEHLKPFGMRNVVDLPALQWLARQKGPRLWLSDGAVTGVGDRSSAVLTERCRALCRRARIRRVATIDEATGWLRRA
jgi:hypothetical protein